MPSTANPGPTPVKMNPGASRDLGNAQNNDAVQSKRDLASWWKQFKRSDKKPQEATAPPEHGIFGVPLQTSIRYANVAISLFNDDGGSYIYGYVPIVVAKCGVFLKEKATDVEGIFRVAGSEKRIKELKVAFDSPDRYGKGLDWTGYTVHDAANILRRYFNQLPEPIIPLDFYDRFRDPIRDHQEDAVRSAELQKPNVNGFDAAKTIKVYQGLITELPPLNRQLLLYILDLLAVFASKADFNKMTTPNLAAIFQPGILSHPQHNMAPLEYRLSQDVLIFLIINQDSFLIGMPGTAADSETVKDVQSGSPRASGAPASPNRAKAIGRSSSNASTGTESRWTNLRRNVSVSSRHSKQSGSGPTPLTPGAGTPNTSGVQRSNTVPSRRTASAAQSPRFSRDKPTESTIPMASTPPAAVDATRHESLQSTPVAPAVATFLPPAPIEITSASSSEATTPLAGGIGSDASSTVTRDFQTPKRDTTPLLAPRSGNEGVTERSVSSTPSASSGRGFLNILKQSPSSEGGEVRKPNKLQKKRIPGSALSSAQSSSHDLGDDNDEANATTPVADALAGQSLQRNPTDATVRRPPSQHSGRSHTSVTDQSDGDMVGDEMGAPAPGSGEKSGKKRRWRFSRNQNKLESGASTNTNPLGTMSPREQAMSKSTIGSGRRESQDPVSLPAAVADSGNASNTDQTPFSDSERERKGPVGWIRGKLQERKEKEAEKRAKTPERKANPAREPSFEVLRHNTQHDGTGEGHVAGTLNGTHNPPPTIPEEASSPIIEKPPVTEPTIVAEKPEHTEKFVEALDTPTTAVKPEERAGELAAGDSIAAAAAAEPPRQ